MKKISIIFLIGIFFINISSAQFDLLNSFKKSNHRVIDVSYSPDGNFIASCGMNNEIVVRDKQGDIVKSYKSKKLIKKVLFTPDSKYIVFGGENKVVSVWDYESGNIRFTLTGHKKAIIAITVSSDNTIASISADNEIKIWNGNKGELLKTITPEDKKTLSIAFSSDGKMFVTGTSEGIISIYETSTFGVIRKIDKAGSGLKNVIFSKDDVFIVSSVNNDVKFWFIENGLLERHLENIHSQTIESIDISNDGQFILCGSYDKTFSIWNMNKAKVFKSKKQYAAILKASFSKNGKNIITCDYTDEIKVWDASSLKIKYVIKKVNDGSADKTPPVITITTPGIKRDLKPVVKKEIITISGKIEDDSEIMIAFLNGAEIKLSEKGEFVKTLMLEDGENLISVKAIDIYNNKSDEQYVVNLQRGVSPFNPTKKEEELSGGIFYALIIGVSEYEDSAIPDLGGIPVNDASKLAEILIKDYTFEEGNVEIIKNATRRDILVSLDNLARNLTDEDNLLIFYAGHGYYEEENDIGYWLPSDAEKDFTPNWIYNNNIVDLLKKIKAKHTLLISDACFSGSIFRGRDATFMKDAQKVYKNMYKLKSRNAMTSGALKTVPNKSIFFEYFYKTLSNNVNPYISSRELFNKVQKSVGNLTDNIPQWGDIPGIGDEGGDFVFIKK